MTTIALRTRPAETRQAAGLGRGLLFLMSAATGLSVASNYFAHPLLDLFSRELNLGTSMAAMIVTAAQIGYGAGLLLLVPLGDLLERRKLAVGLFMVTAASLLVSATAPNGAVLLAGTVLTAFASVAAQVLVPFAAALAAPEQRGRVVGTVMTGLLLGALLSRTVSGGLSELGGWRTVYWVNALLMAAMAALLWRALPAMRSDAGLSYPALIKSTLLLFREEPVLRWRAGIGALSFAAFNGVWVALAFLLARPPYGWTEAAIGLFGLVGVGGPIAASMAGRQADRGGAQRVTGVGTLGMLASWGLLALGGSSLPWLLGGLILLSLAQQGLLVANQNVVYALRPEARNRLNAAFMTSNFVGGAAGSALVSVAWVNGGWSGVVLLGTVLSAGTVALWLLERARTKK
ncbi:MFS transporter [Actinomadura kijaniata]|uniref:Putative MFS family arabinose efflux permease n=1 Tax=Actinomadura namibiensis TaxID=182080 RepID=A0A7W3QP12_ACTNM|nr:MFS transporter [Actinomadura namibiensis]MBA8954164.1 putative MFS family arabinose efflux permease [Actinomadura namibiensis]